MNKELLIKRIKESGMTRKYIAWKMEITPNSLQNKVSGRTPFTVSEVKNLAIILKLSKEDTFDIFLPNVFA